MYLCNAPLWRHCACGAKRSNDIMMFSLSLTADDVGWDLPRTEPVSFHGLITVSATEASLLLDPVCGMLYLQNSDMTSALDSLGANWSRICLSRALNHGALWRIVFLRLRNILTYLLTYLYLLSRHIARKQTSRSRCESGPDLDSGVRSPLCPNPDSRPVCLPLRKQIRPINLAELLGPS